MSYNSLCSIGWIIIQTVCLCCLKPGVSVLDKHVFGRRNDKMTLSISSKREKLSSLWIHAVYLQHPFCACRFSYLFLAKSKGCDRAMQRRRNLNLRWPKWLSFRFHTISHFRTLNSELRIPKFILRISEFWIRNCVVYVMRASGNS